MLVHQTTHHTAGVYAAAAATISCLLKKNHVISLFSNNTKQRGRQIGAKTRRRTRLDLAAHFNDLGPTVFRRCYRMTQESFWNLLEIIGKHLPSYVNEKQVPNGPITKAARLSMALRYFAGGDPLDISCIHKVSTVEVTRSVWFVVNAVNKTKQLDIVFPTDHAEQQLIAEGFKRKSTIGLSNCVGAIDGVLVWTHKPSKPDIKKQPFGDGKMYCGRKHKFGLNMQAICDSQQRFLDVSICNPGSASDYYCWHYSSFREKCLKDNFLANGLCLYGDCAYVSTPFMMTPYVRVPDDATDAYNYFHSQLRINIECAFGVLVHRWGILRKPIPANISIRKTVALVIVLCKLHNYCIHEKTKLSKPFIADRVNIINTGGGFPLPRMDGNENDWSYEITEKSRDRVEALLDGGHHTQDFDYEIRREFRRRRDITLPSTAALQTIRELGYRRPPSSC